MKKLLGILLVVVMLAAFAIPNIVAVTKYDIQITSDVVIDEQIHDVNGDYPWWKYGKFDAVIDGEEVKGITPGELQRDPWGSITWTDSQASDDPWTVGSTHEGTINVHLWDDSVAFSASVKVTVGETNISSIKANPITIYEGGVGKDGENTAVVTFKDGTTEEVPMFYHGEWPTEIGTYEKKAFAYDCIEIPATVKVEKSPYDIQILSDIVIDEKIQYATGGYPWQDYGKMDAIVAGTEYKGITPMELRKAVVKAYDFVAISSWDDHTSADAPWAVGSTHEGHIELVRYDNTTLFSATVNITVQETKIESIKAEPITIYEGGFGTEYENTAIVTYKDGSTEKVPMYYRGEWPTEVDTYEKKAFAYNCVEVPVTINVVPFDADVKITSDIVIDAQIHDANGEYLWADYGKLDAVVAGTEFKGITPRELESAIDEAYGDCGIFGGDDQYNSTWAVGSTHDGTIEFFRRDDDNTLIFATNVKISVQETKIDSIKAAPITIYEGGLGTEYENTAIVTYKDGTTEEVPMYYRGEWPTEVGTYEKKAFAYNCVEIPVTIKVVAFEAKITSDIVIDAQIVSDHNYMWDQYGKLDAIVAGKEYKNITFTEFQSLVSENYEGCEIYCIDDQDEKEWTVDSAYNVTLHFLGEDYNTILTADANVIVQETTIESIKTDPITCYQGGYGAGDDEYSATVTYKDGSTEKAPMYCREFPTEAGKQEGTALVYGCIEAPVTFNVKVYPNTSGKCGDNMTWTYDTATKKLTISGTGSMYKISEDRGILWGEYLYEPEFWYWYWGIQDIVVEEGVEYLSDGAFMPCDQLVTLKLPSTLKELPLRMLAYTDKMNTFVIPEGITSLIGYPLDFTSCVEELYLPSTLKEMDIMTIYFAGMRTKSLKKIHFAGTEEQWNAIKRVRNEVILERFGGSESIEPFYDKVDKDLKNVEIIFNSKPSITVEDGVATVPDVVVEVAKGENAVIDVTGTPAADNVSNVVIGSDTVDKIAKAETTLDIKLPDATVSFDKTAVGSIDKQSGDNTITIVAKEVAENTLNDKQKDAVKDKEVCNVITLEAFAGNTKVTDFGGGKVTVSIPFELPAGKEGKDFYVAYVADDGTVTAMPTTYADGKLSFTTTHFSSYVVLENKAAATETTVTPETTATPETTQTDSPVTGDNGCIMMLALLAVACTAAVAVCVAKKRRDI